MNNPNDRPDAVNWDPPHCRETVQRALEDGLTDPDEIARWARTQYGVDFPLDEIRAAIESLKHSKGHQKRPGHGHPPSE